MLFAMKNVLTESLWWPKKVYKNSPKRPQIKKFQVEKRLYFSQKSHYRKKTLNHSQQNIGPRKGLVFGAPHFSS